VGEDPCLSHRGQAAGFGQEKCGENVRGMEDKHSSSRASVLQIVGKLFHDASYELEGDGFCIAFVHRHVALVSKLQQEVTRDRTSFRMIGDAVQAALGNGLPHAMVESFAKRLFETAEATLRHFGEAIMKKMDTVLPLYHAASLFDPQRFLVEYNKPIFRDQRRLFLDHLAGLKGVPVGVREGLDAEFGLFEGGAKSLGGVR
jgi:hypothetical protein